jgi:DNA-binding NarL/FixJ family response regulator
MVCFHATASCGAHLLDQIGAAKQESDGLSELFAVPVGIKETGDAMLDEFAARTQCLLRWLRVSYPKIAPVLLVEDDDPELVVNALRAGAKGIFLFTHTPFPMLCKCIHCVFRGEVWIDSQQMNYVLDALSEVPTLRVVNSSGRCLLTPREEQVVALVADGLTNRGVAVELGLSEHTIKKYLLRIFDKVGISSRVELVLYAMSHGEHCPAEWMPSSNA